jgi:hypothetical protein
MVAPLGVTDVVVAAVGLLAEQRTWLRAVADEAWSAELARAADAEAGIVGELAAALPAERISIPTEWSAPRAIAALAETFSLRTV